MTKLQTIREACIKANDEIVELKTGCWIEWGGGIKYTSMIVMQNDKGNYIVWDEEKISNCRYNQVNVIIGRKIGIADVIYAVHTEAATNFHYAFSKMDKKILSIWNLKETLENQKEEVWDLIISLLPKV